MVAYDKLNINREVSGNYCLSALGAVLLTNFKKMKKKFIIQNAIDKKYWYGFYTNKNWTDDILEARLFENKQEMEDWIEVYQYYFEGMFLVAIEVWY